MNGQQDHFANTSLEDFRLPPLPVPVRVARQQAARETVEQAQAAHHRDGTHQVAQVLERNRRVDRERMADLSDDRLRRYRGDWSRETSLKHAFKQQVVDWKKSDAAAAIAFEDHLKHAVAAAHTFVRALGIAAWYGDISSGVRQALMKLLEHHHGEAELADDLRVKERNTGSRGSTLSDGEIETQHAATNTRVSFQSNANVQVVIQAFVPFGTGSDMDSVAELNWQDDIPQEKTRHTLLRLLAGLQVRKALLHAHHPRHTKRTQIFADSVQSRVMAWCHEALTAIEAFDDNHLFLSAGDKSLLNKLSEGLDLFAKHTTYDEIHKMQTHVKEYVGRFQALHDFEDGDSGDSEDENMVTEEEMANQNWLEEQERRFLAFEERYGPVLGTEWKKGAMTR